MDVKMLLPDVGRGESGFVDVWVEELKTILISIVNKAETSTNSD